MQVFLVCTYRNVHLPRYIPPVSAPGRLNVCLVEDLPTIAKSNQVEAVLYVACIRLMSIPPLNRSRIDVENSRPGLNKAIFDYELAS